MSPLSLVPFPLSEAAAAPAAACSWRWRRTYKTAERAHTRAPRKDDQSNATRLAEGYVGAPLPAAAPATILMTDTVGSATTAVTFSIEMVVAVAPTLCADCRSVDDVFGLVARAVTATATADTAAEQFASTAATAGFAAADCAAAVAAALGAAA